jgi:hypothetical protein
MSSIRPVTQFRLMGLILSSQEVQLVRHYALGGFASEFINKPSSQTFYEQVMLFSILIEDNYMG